MSLLTDAEILAAVAQFFQGGPSSVDLRLSMPEYRAIEAATAAKYAERIAELERELAETNEMNDQLREQNTAVDVACAELGAKLDAAAKLLKRAPKATRSMYVGTDIEPWGVQAAALVRSIDAMRTGEQKV